MAFTRVNPGDKVRTHHINDVYDAVQAAQADVAATEAAVGLRLWGSGLDMTGATDEAAAFATLLADGRPLELGEGTVSFGSGLTIPDNAVIVGAGRGKTVLSHDFNGDLFTMGNNVTLRDLTIEGNGATYTGRGLTYPSGKGNQHLDSVEVINFDGPCEYYVADGGSNAKHTRCLMYRTSAGTGTGRYAVVIDPTQQLAAYPKSFVQFDTAGQCAIDFGGGNNIYVSASTVGDLNYTGDTRFAAVTGSRILNQAALTVDGHNNTIVGCDVNPQITIASGADNCAIGPNSYNSLPVVDSSGNTRNQITHHTIAYTATLTSGGTAPSLGNGALEAVFSRAGGLIQLSIILVVGSTTSLGTGDLRFAMPYPRASLFDDYPGNAVVTISGTSTRVQPVVQGGTSYVWLLQAGGAGPVTYNSPGVFAAGDTIRITLTYQH